MPQTNDANREARIAEHRDFIERRFLNYPLPEGKTAWDDGLMIVFVAGGASDNGRIHRASCRSISQVANARTYKKHGGAYAIGQDGIVARSERCATCGTESLPVGAQFWGDTERTITDRADARFRDGRVKDFQQAMASQIHAARNAAIAEVLAAHAEQVDALAQTHLIRLQAEVRTRFADVADTQEQ